MQVLVVVDWLSGGFLTRESLTHKKLGGGNSNYFLWFSSRIPGEDESNLTGAYFSNGLVQPPTRIRGSKEQGYWRSRNIGGSFGPPVMNRVWYDNTQRLMLKRHSFIPLFPWHMYRLLVLTVLTENPRARCALAGSNLVGNFQSDRCASTGR